MGEARQNLEDYFFVRDLLDARNSESIEQAIERTLANTWPTRRHLIAHFIQTHVQKSGDVVLAVRETAQLARSGKWNRRP